VRRALKMAGMDFRHNADVLLGSNAEQSQSQGQSKASP
jgi:hypothetical protein